MDYNLKFIKISPEHQFAGVGFAGNIFITLNALTHININDRMRVDMETNECVCTEKNVNLHNTNNCWEYYFDQTGKSDMHNPTEMNSLLSANINYEDRNMFMYPENFVELKNKFYKSFKIKNHITTILDDFYNEKIKNKITLGVQIRLTDMKHYHNVSSVDLYISKINQILIDNPDIEQIFLATDDGTIINKVKDNVGVPVIYYTGMFRSDENNSHIHPYDRFIPVRDNHRYLLGIECMQEIFTLSKCDFLLKADVSSVSIVAIILSENIKKVYKL
jgi:hypothetical protein